MASNLPLAEMLFYEKDFRHTTKLVDSSLKRTKSQSSPVLGQASNESKSTYHPPNQCAAKIHHYWLALFNGFSGAFCQAFHKISLY